MALRVSVLDLAAVGEGATPADALRHTLDLAQRAERWGYTRFWVAEHHNMPGIASAATAVVIGYVAAGTSTLRVGSGGIMLPNHSPLVIAEQFGTLESLYPGRIDLGLGRAPGTDAWTVRALRRPLMAADTFPQDVLELQALLGPPREGQRIQATPGAGTNVPLWILGSSLFGAQLAAQLRLPYAYASHFAPDLLLPALDAYRVGFITGGQPAAGSRQAEADHPQTVDADLPPPPKASADHRSLGGGGQVRGHLDYPYAMAGINVFAADTDAEARRLMTSAQQSITNRFRGHIGRLPPPIDDIDAYWNAGEKAEASARLACTVTGSPSVVREGLLRFVERTGVDEIIVSSMIYDHAARLRSYEIVADVIGL